MDRIYADLSQKRSGRSVKLTTVGTRRDLTRFGLELSDGLALRMWTDDADDEGQPDPLLFEGTARWDAKEDCWMADVDWEAVRHASGRN
jgi:hypothetical protein